MQCPCFYLGEWHRYYYSIPPNVAATIEGKLQQKQHRTIQISMVSRLHRSCNRTGAGRSPSF